MNTISDIKRLVVRTQEKKEFQFEVGMRVKMSRIGRDSLKQMPRYSQLGVVTQPSACYPGSVSVRRDGAKTPAAYHPSYWEPA